MATDHADEEFIASGGGERGEDAAAWFGVAECDVDKWSKFGRDLVGEQLHHGLGDLAALEGVGVEETWFEFFGEEHGGLEDLGAMVGVEVSDGVAEGFEQVAAFVADQLERLNDGMGEVAIGGSIGTGRVGREVLQHLSCFGVGSPVVHGEMANGGGSFGADLGGAIVEGNSREIGKSWVEAALDDLDAVQSRLGIRVARRGAQGAEEMCSVRDDIGLGRLAEVVVERRDGFQALVGYMREEDAQEISLPTFGDMR